MRWGFWRFSVEVYTFDSVRSPGAGVVANRYGGKTRQASRSQPVMAASQSVGGVWLRTQDFQPIFLKLHGEQISSKRSTRFQFDSNNGLLHINNLRRF